jgi:uncharacterized protein YjiS (DUF1127 family)
MPGSVRQWWRAACNEVSEWPRRARQRKERAQMTHYELRDAGITCHEAQHELAKPIWRA